ncbi:hypothetical protein [Proteus terrae]|uniref:hypothetical protein n=1 Tax=Proteus terrae TaxID=1574161 RepID=UPI0032DA028E
MKLNITVDLDWLEEDGNIDEEVKHEIINGVKNAISKDCLAKVEKEASKQIDKAIAESITSAQQAINQRAVQFVEDWLVKEVTITDKWGDIKEQISVKDMVKRSFDQTLEKTVDSSGRFTENHYNGLTLIKYLTGNYVQELVREKIKPLQEEIDLAIVNAVNAGIRKNVSDKFAEMVVMTAKHQNALEHK